MIEYKLCETAKLKHDNAVVVDKLLSKVFALNSIYVGGFLHTHSGIINKKCMLIYDKTCGDSNVVLQLDGTINKFLLFVEKDVNCLTTIDFTAGFSEKRIRFQVYIYNPTNIDFTVDLKGINIKTSQFTLAGHQFVILDAYIIAGVITGSFDKQPYEDYLLNYKTKASDVSSDLFQNMVSTFSLGNLGNVQNNLGIHNGKLVKTQSHYKLNIDAEDEFPKIIITSSDDVKLDMKTVTNLEIIFETNASEMNIHFQNTINIHFQNTINRGLIKLTNHRNSDLTLNITKNSKNTQISLNGFKTERHYYMPYSDAIDDALSSKNIKIKPSVDVVNILEKDSILNGVIMV